MSALKDWSEVLPDPRQLEIHQDRPNGESTDRDTAVLVAGNLETALQDALASHLQLGPT